MERASMLHLEASHDDHLVAFDSLGAMLDFCADSDHQAPVCAVTAREPGCDRLLPEEARSRALSSWA